MSSQKIIRSICWFTNNPSAATRDNVNTLSKILEDNGFSIQTKRVCSSIDDPQKLENLIDDPEFYLSVGSISPELVEGVLPFIYKTRKVNFNVDLTNKEITLDHAGLLFTIMRENAPKTFCFSYVFNNALSTPYFPSASYEREGFAIGLQPTDLSEGSTTLEEWFEQMRFVWQEVDILFKSDPNFLGIDSSIAPLYQGPSSLVNFVKRLGYSLVSSTTSDLYVRMTRFIKEENPQTIGLCGLMLPCLEDFELADEYEKGEFSIERNIYLSLHSGLGIDTYPIGMDERPERVLEILKLLQALSNKYQKPLSCRFVSDGKAGIGDRTNFQNQFLKDVSIRAL